MYIIELSLYHINKKGAKHPKCIAPFKRIFASSQAACHRRKETNYMNAFLSEHSNLLLIALIIYSIINLIVLALYGIDKIKAITKGWRIPEKTLIISSIFGIFGAILGMVLFRHKIRKPKFYITLPLILFFEGIVCVIFLAMTYAGMQ